MKLPFGVEEDTESYRLTASRRLAVRIQKRSGDITSLLYQGIELQGSDKPTHIASGLEPARVSVRQFGDEYILVTIETDADHPSIPSLTHYIAIRQGYDILHLATYPQLPNKIGELRWIARLNATALPFGPQPSCAAGGALIEGRDVFRLPDGTTRSKYYGDNESLAKQRAIDLTVCGVRGPNAAVWMVYDLARESASGGPFFRDIQHQQIDDQQLYNYMYSSHYTADKPRVGVLHGPYALVFTAGEEPSLPIDHSWIHTLPLQGVIPTEGRGGLRGRILVSNESSDYTVTLSNGAAQYWSRVDQGTYAISCAKPGLYTVTFYRHELAIFEGKTTIYAGHLTNLDLHPVEEAPRQVIFAIASRTGIPLHHNSRSVPLLRMHPTDPRMPAFKPFVFRAMIDEVGTFPLLQVKQVNSPGRIIFSLTADQVIDLTFALSITAAYKRGRPKVTVNSHALPVPPPSEQPTTRCYTVGTYRGNNTTFTFELSHRFLTAGENVLEIDVVSDWESPESFLNAGWIYDALELYAAPTRIDNS